MVEHVASHGGARGIDRKKWQLKSQKHFSIGKTELAAINFRESNEHRTKNVI
jgi:hypothetical protein